MTHFDIYNEQVRNWQVLENTGQKQLFQYFVGTPEHLNQIRDVWDSYSNITGLKVH